MTPEREHMGCWEQTMSEGRLDAALAWHREHEHIPKKGRR